MNNQNKAHNQKQRRNTRIFAVLMLLSQLACSFLYSFLYQIESHQLNLSAITNTIALAILVTVGFGLVLSFLKRLLWSGLGFTLFITAFCIELYPLVNYFWTLSKIHTINNLNLPSHQYSLFLANSSLPADKISGNCLTNSFKCALAIVAAFSSILGRAGALECYIVTVVGTIGFQLNRQLLLNFAMDRFGTFFIFTFGGFMGLALGVILRFFKEKMTNGCSTAKNIFNQSSMFNSSLAIIGSLVIFTLFPFLAYDVDSAKTFNTFYLHTAPTSVLIGMAASVMGAYCTSSLINYKVISRDLLHAPIAGGIVVGSAASFIVSPVYALVAGFTAGSLQTIIQNCVERPWLKEKSVISTISWSLFGIQGILGGVFASAYKRIIDSSQANFSFSTETVNFNPGEELLMAVISAGMGLGVGIISGLLLLLVSRHKSSDFFVDRTYWHTDDGLAFKNDKPVKSSKKPSVIIQAPPPPQPIPANPLPLPPDQLSDDSLKGKQSNVRIEYSQVIPFDPSTPNFQMSFSQPSAPEKQHAFL